MSSVDLGKRDINQLASNVQLPQWLTDFINGVKASYKGLNLLFRLFWSLNIKPAVQAVIDDLKNGQFNIQLVSDIKNMLVQFGHLVSRFGVLYWYYLASTIQMFFELIWEHRQDILNFIVQTLGTLWVLGLNAIFYVLVYLLPEIEADLEKAWELIKEVIKKIFGNFLNSI